MQIPLQSHLIAQILIHILVGNVPSAVKLTWSSSSIFVGSCSVYQPLADGDMVCIEKP